MMEPKPRCLGSIFVSIYRVTKGRDATGPPRFSES